MYPAGHPGIAARIVALTDGLRVRVIESGPSHGVPILLVHGWGASVYTFRHLIPALAAAGRRAFAVDLRGHGLSDKPVGSTAYRSDRMLGDLLGTMDALGIDRADVVGHSLGGGISFRLALDHPERVRRLVLASPVGLTRIRLRRFATVVTPRITNRFAGHLVPRQMVEFLARGAYGDPSAVRECDIDEYWAPSRSPDYYRAIRALLHEFDWRPLSPEDLKRVRATSLVILATADRLIRGGEASARRLAAASVITLEGAGHLAIEERANDVNDAIVRFLDSGHAP